jgi:hypothetical protein
MIVAATTSPVCEPHSREGPPVAKKKRPTRVTRVFSETLVELEMIARALGLTVPEYMERATEEARKRDLPLARRIAAEREKHLRKTGQGDDTLLEDGGD